MLAYRLVRKMQTDIKLAICYFMPENIYLKNALCIPIQLGPAETGLDLGINKDNEGDNRSDRHPYYSEYSGIYWLWKNTTADYKGMFHHRRFMTLEKVPASRFVKHFGKKIIYGAANAFIHRPFYFQRAVVCGTDEEYIAKANDFLGALPGLLEAGGYDIVVPQRFLYYHTNVIEAFDEVVNRFILKVLEEVFDEDFPSYAEYFHRTLYGNRLYYSNMHVMKNDIYDEFCGFTFGVFDRLEDRLISGGYYLNLSQEKSMSRVFGYIGELMTNTYILSSIDRGRKVKELPLLFNASAKGNENINYQSMRCDSDGGKKER